MGFQWDWEFTFETVLPQLLVGFRITVMATILGMMLALVLGLLLAIGRRSSIKFVSYPIGFLIEFVRSTPLLVQLFFLYYVLPDYGISLSPLTIGILALGVHYSSYTAEVYRAGIEAVDRGQWEAATSLNLSPLQTWRRIIIPQSIPPVVPALGNYLIAMFKDTPLLQSITVLEVLYVSRQIQSETFRAIEPLTMVGILFLVVSLISAQLVKLVEKWTRLPR